MAKTNTRLVVIGDFVHISSGIYREIEFLRGYTLIVDNNGKVGLLARKIANLSVVKLAKL